MRSLALVALLFSAQAFACPNLTGTYTCTYQDGSSEVVNLTQENKNGVIVYNYNGSEIPADNVAYPVPDDANLRSATFRSWCPDTVNLNAQLVGKYYQDNEYFGDLDMTTSMSLDGANLKQVTTGTLTNAGGTYPLNAEMVCTRN